MSNTKRPSLARQDTRKTKEARRAELDQGVRIIFDGEVYEIRLGDVTPVLARRFRRAYGAPFSELLEELSDAADIDSIAAVVWMARLLAGDDVEFDEIAISYADIDDLEIEQAKPTGDGGGGESPEA